MSGSETPRPEERFAASSLPPAARTLLIPLAYRAAESGRQDAILRDDAAAALLARFDEDYSRLLRGQRMERVCVLMRARQMDQYARRFVEVHPGAIVVDLGCGLDTRPSRLGAAASAWFGLDFPEVIALRERLFPKRRNETLIAGSLVDHSWMDVIACERKPVVFLAEGVLPYLEADDVRRMIVALASRFPGAELACDVMNRFSVRAHSLTHAAIRRSEARLGWWLNEVRTLEAWSPRIRLLEEWSYFDQAEPRLKGYRWMRHIELFSHANWILRLGFVESS